MQDKKQPLYEAYAEKQRVWRFREMSPLFPSREASYLSKCMNPHYHYEAWNKKGTRVGVGESRFAFEPDQTFLEIANCQAGDLAQGLIMGSKRNKDPEKAKKEQIDLMALKTCAHLMADYFVRWERDEESGRDFCSPAIMELAYPHKNLYFDWRIQCSPWGDEEEQKRVYAQRQREAKKNEVFRQEVNAENVARLNVAKLIKSKKKEIDNRTEAEKKE